MIKTQMVSNEIKVGIADYKVDLSPKRIVTLGLGSCVGITLYDPVIKLGGMVHIMLPDSRQFNRVSNPLKFADLAIPMLFKELSARGARTGRLHAKITGGAQMFTFAQSRNSTLNIGERNVAKVKEILERLCLPIIAEEVGGNFGRTMILDLENGKVFIRSAGKPIRELQEAKWTSTTSKTM